MNLPKFTKNWRCGHPRCRERTSGMGDAIGLRALGWHVAADESGRQAIRCPLHRTDGVPCRDPLSHGIGSDDGTCSLCSAENEAKGWQGWISGRPAGETLGDPEEAPWTT